MARIVQVNVQTTNAPTPSKLQQTGAIVTSGGSTLSPGQTALLTQPSDATPIIATPKTLSALTYSSNQVTATTTVPHGWPIGAVFSAQVTGTVPAGYGLATPELITITTASQFTYTIGSNPGTATTFGTVLPTAALELTGAVASFFAQGTSTSVYVLEVGVNSVTADVTFLQNWITQNPGIFYSYLVPRAWDGNAAFLTMLATFESTTAKTYFFITTTLSSYMLYPAQMKCALLFVEAIQYPVITAGTLIATAMSLGAQSPGWAVTFTTTGNTSSPGVTNLFAGATIQLTGFTPSAYNGYWYCVAGTGPNGINAVNFGLSSNPGTPSVYGSIVPTYTASAGLPGELVTGANTYYSTTEFDAAAALQITLSYAPSSTNKVPPLAYSYMYGVTPFPTAQNSAIIATLLAVGVNLVGTGAEGGISNTLLLGGNTADNNPFNYWYSIDWVAINLDLNVSNAIINGSNNNINPLFLNQAGVNVLQAVCANTMTSAVTFGLALNPVIEIELTGPQLGVALDNNTYGSYSFVNAVPFPAYYTASPGDYKIGKYAGLSVGYAPLRGFENVIINVTATTFAA